MDFLINYGFSGRILVGKVHKNTYEGGCLNSFLHFCI